MARDMKAHPTEVPPFFADEWIWATATEVTEKVTSWYADNGPGSDVPISGVAPLLAELQAMARAQLDRLGRPLG